MPSLYKTGFSLQICREKGIKNIPYVQKHFIGTMTAIAIGLLIYHTFKSKVLI